MDIAVNYVPTRHVVIKGCACILIKFIEKDMVKASQMHAKR